jgi:hypothetical protein
MVSGQRHDQHQWRIHYFQDADVRPAHILPDAKIEIRRFSIFFVAAVCDRRVVLQFCGSPALADRCHSSFAVS